MNTYAASCVVTNYAYNPRGFLADLRNTAPPSSGGAVLSEFGGTVGTSAAMTYDGVGNRTAMTTSNTATTTTFAYNSADELTQEQNFNSSGPFYTDAYTYDGAQNRTSAYGNAINHNADNQFSDTSHYGYDGNGNPTTYTSPGNSVTFNTVSTNTFDPENRMTGYSAGGGLTASYDSDGLRASKTVSSGTTYYLYDEQDRPVVELNASGAATAVNTFGDNGLLSRYTVSAGASSFYAFDPQGSAVDVMQGIGTASYSYTAFGLLARGATPSTPWQFGAQWGYYTDAETGLVLCTHRYYDPYTGRFVNRDPLAYDGGINLYNYANDNPVKEKDTSGEAFIDCDKAYADAEKALHEYLHDYNKIDPSNAKHMKELCQRWTRLHDTFEKYNTHCNRSANSLPPLPPPPPGNCRKFDPQCPKWYTPPTSMPPGETPAPEPVGKGEVIVE